MSKKEDMALSFRRIADALEKIASNPSYPLIPNFPNLTPGPSIDPYPGMPFNPAPYDPFKPWVVSGASNTLTTTENPINYAVWFGKNPEPPSNSSVSIY